MVIISGFGDAVLPPGNPATGDQEINPFVMRFLFEKQLQNSDVSSAGRIVIPKKFAETNLPILNEKGGFWMHFDDMDYPLVWTFKFRFWPNNRGRVYLFENAREFTGKYCLELGDYLMVFKDDINGSYLVRARKKAAYVPTGAMGNNANANASYPNMEKYLRYGDNNNNQHDFRDGPTPEYAHLIMTPCCESLDLDFYEFLG
ncbi:B3 domain-containing transcription factor [Melia azedarach]|uniref:B3 domain-containing transcription factor n=1 Tax=Melia azedarach TaxID=155640 RepID=A0ACC1XIX6_MELAZ|nr:B3 domain-containing transcription factor [Melia azedarach]